MALNWKLNMIISAVVTVLCFLASDKLLSFKWWVDVVIALAFGGIVNLFILQDKKEDHEIEVVPGLSKHELNETLKKGREWAMSIAGVSKKLKPHQPETAARILEISHTVDAIFSNFQTDPGDLTSVNATRLLHDHLPRAHRFMESYSALASAKKLTPAEQEKLGVMEGRIATIGDTFTKHLEGFRNNDFTSLEVEGETMETIYKLDI